MKRNILFLSFLFICLFSIQAMAQTPSFSIVNNKIVLNASVPVPADQTYELDLSTITISKTGLSTDEQYAKYFEAYQKEYAVITIDLPNNKAKLVLNGALIADATLTAQQWNTIFANTQ